MASNYEQSATLVPAFCFAEGGAKAAEQIVQQLQETLDSDDCPKDLEDCLIDGIEVEATSDGSLYITSGDDYFCYFSFEYLVEKLAERNLILKSFGIQIAYTCSKLRPGEFGGTYWRAFPCGKLMPMGTHTFDDLTDDKFEQIYRICNGG